MQFEPLDGSTQCHLNISDVKYKGVSVLNWFVYYLITRCPKEKRLGTYVLKIKFFKEQTFTTDTNKKLKTSVIEYTITRELFFKEKYIEVTEGDGYFDWQKEQPKYPQGGNIKVEVINPDIVLSEEPAIEVNQLVTEKYNFFLHCFLDGLPNINKLPKLDSLASIDFSFSPNLQMQKKDLSRLLIG